MSGTIYMMAGGTGGHVIPALAVARALAERGYDIRWLGTRRGIEARLVPEAGFPIDWLEIGGVRGKNWATRLLAPVRLVRALLAARRLMARHRPVLAIGMGGYASGPGGLAARWLGIPLVIHEQNAVAGLTNRVLARMATRVLAAYVGAFGNLKQFVAVVGNPVRPEIAGLPEPETRFAARSGPVRVLVLGGSLGAKALNEQVPVALARLSHRLPLEIRHQAGTRNLDEARTNYAQSTWSEQGRYEVLDFIGDMAESYGWADFVIARAGALTVAEIAAAGVGALFIPFPHAVDDHQTRNAALLVQQEAALLIQQRDLTVTKLADQLQPVLADRQQLLAMARAARQSALPQALKQIVEICQETARQPRRREVRS